MSMLSDALTYATIAHAGQYDKAGRPYIEHPVRVARTVLLEGHLNVVVAAALLHDVLEDTPIEYKDLRSEFGITCANYVRILTRDSEHTSGQYYDEVRKHPQTLAIKRADIRDNLDKTRLARLYRPGDGRPPLIGQRAEGQALVRRLVRKYETACDALGLDLVEVAGYDPVQYWDVTT